MVKVGLTGGERTISRNVFFLRRYSVNVKLFIIHTEGVISTRPVCSRAYLVKVGLGRWGARDFLIREPLRCYLVQVVVCMARA